MVKRVALIHTVRNVLDRFEPLLRASAEFDLKVHNILDDFLATDPAETGCFSAVNRERLKNDLANAEATGADLIAVTCSTLTPAVAELRARFRTPIVAVDDAMCRKAVRFGPKVTVLATAQSTEGPTRAKLRAEAEAAGVELELESMVCAEALEALKAGDRETHDTLVAEMAGRAKGRNVVVLAQASMAGLESRISRICGCPVLSSPELCVAQIIGMLEESK